MSHIDWTTIGVLVGVIAPLVGVPLMMITLYLRNIRDYQVSRYDELVDRVGFIDGAVHDVSKLVREFERDYTTKEEWLRESMHARRQLEKLSEGITRIQAELENGTGLVRQFAQAAQAMVRLTEALVSQNQVDRQI